MTRRDPQLTVVGTLAFDDVQTPAGRREGVLGGSATYFGVAASYFTSVGIVGVVGEDFPDAFRSVLTGHNLDISGVDVVEGGKTFHWSGRYEGAMDQAESLQTDLNVLETFAPTLPGPLAASPYVFLANTDPSIQSSVLDQLTDPRLVVLDTMNWWIDSARDVLMDVMKRVDGVIINDQEARDLARTSNLVAAGKWLLDNGPKRFVIVKKGEHGCFLFSEARMFALPSYPLDHVVDPTGAGDSFAGGIMGSLAESDAAPDDANAICRAMLHGTCVASFTVSDFSLDMLGHLDRKAIDARVRQLQAFTSL